MKKIRLYLLTFVLLLSFVSLGIFSCSKKKKLTLSSLVITVLPNPASVEKGHNETFIATALRNGSPVSVDFTWSVSPSTLGTITDEGVFTGSESGSGTVVASAEGESGSADVRVGADSNYYGILSDTYLNPSIKFDTNNPPDPDGGYMGFWPFGEISMAGDNTTYTEAPGSSKITITSGWAGMYVMFGYDGTPSGGSAVETDMSFYSDAYLRFDVKTSTEVIVGVEWQGGSASKKIHEDLGIEMDDTWYPVEIDLSTLPGIDFSTIKLPFLFSVDGGTGGTVFWIDKVRWEK